VSAVLCPAIGSAPAQAPEGFLELSGGSPAAEAVPTVTITAPASEPTDGVALGAVAVTGTATGDVTLVTWASDRGVSGIATGTRDWRVDAVPLQAGANVITVMAYDAAGNVARATLTITSTAPADAPTSPASNAADSTGTTSGATYALTPPIVLSGVPVTSRPSTLTTTSPPAKLAAAPSVGGGTSAGQPGLVAAYAFDEGAGTTVIDYSGNDNTGTLSGGVAWTPQGRLGGALVFHGSAMVTVPNSASLALTDGMTLEAWVYPTATPTTWTAAVVKEQAYALHAGSPTGRPGARFSIPGNGERIVNGRGMLPPDTWTHLAATFDGASLRLYVNGSQVASTVGAGPIVGSTGALHIGGHGVLREFFRGRIDEVRVYNRALSAAEIQADMVEPISSGTQPPDITPPSVTLTSPGNGTTVFGTVSVAATASDNVGVTGVQFLVDGTPLGDELPDPPYSVVWDTSGVTPGQHIVTAVARDAAGNTKTSAPVQVTLADDSPAALGQWAGPFADPIVTIHGTLLNTGKVLVWDGLGNGGDVHLWNPATNTFTAAASADSNIFCSGHCLLADGRVFVAGGHTSTHEGLRDANLFDPGTGTWTFLPQMDRERWYPTATTLPDGRVLVTAGEDGCSQCNVTLPEVYNPATNTWTPLSSALLDLPFYPHMFVLPDGRVLAASSTEDAIQSHVLNVATQTWSLVDPVAVDGGSAVMYLPGNIMKSGTHNDADLPTIPSAATTYVLDMTHAPPSHWAETASMAFARAYHNLTILPDGSVLATGGGTTTDAVGLSDAILAAELWSPVTQTWTTLASMQTERLYHSIALLLPDARVLVSGGGRFFGEPHPTDRPSHEIYSPPYLFRGTRPVITTAPTSVTYSTTMQVQTPDAARIAAVSLIRPGSVTHSFNRDQRLVPLPFTVLDAGTLTVQTPASANLAPPGFYMLFLVDTSGVPSVAKFVRIQ
jgi:Concanavalin A-like lectin/glucanases superfamily/Domain of unknown function (DUF1929)/Bacterial Ig domain/Kelch motif